MKSSLEVISNKRVTLTAEAAEKMRRALEQFSAAGVRITAKQSETGAVSFSLDVAEDPGPDDLVLEDRGIKLFVDPSSTEHIEGIEIGYIEAERRSGFSVVNSAFG